MKVQVILLLGVYTAVTWGDSGGAAHHAPAYHPPQPTYGAPPKAPQHPPATTYGAPQKGYHTPQITTHYGTPPTVSSGGKGKGKGGYGSSGGFGGFRSSGGKGNSKGKDDDYSHIDFGPPRWVV